MALFVINLLYFKVQLGYLNLTWKTRLHDYKQQNVRARNSHDGFQLQTQCLNGNCFCTGNVLFIIPLSFIG